MTAKRLLRVPVFALLVLVMCYSTCSSNRAPLAPEFIVAPAGGCPDSTYKFVVLSSDPDGDDVVYRFDWGDGDTSFWSPQWVISGNPDSMSHQWSSSGSFEVRAQAKDVQSMLSEWSESHQLPLAYAPAMPTDPTGPGFGEVGSTYTFSVSSSDPGVDSQRYVFSWDDGTFDTTGFVPGPSTASLVHAWQGSGTYLVKARSMNFFGDTSDWTNPLEVRIASGTDSLKWRFSTGSVWVVSSPALGPDGTLYAGSYNNYLFALNPDGSEKWRFKTSGHVRASAAIAIDGTVYIGSQDGVMYALYADGSLKWSFSTGGQINSSAAIAVDGTIYFGSYDDNLYALGSDGSERWRYTTGGGIYSSPAVGADGTIYFGSYDDSVHALNPDGSLKWKYPTGGSIEASPSVGADGTVYIGSADGYLYALNPDGTLGWRFYAGSHVKNTASIDSDGTIYSSIHGRTLYALNPDGSLKWSRDVSLHERSTPTIGAGGSIFLWCCDGSLQVHDRDGHKKGDFETGGDMHSSPVIAGDGTMYVGSLDGWVYAIRCGETLAATPWPMFRRDRRHTGRVPGDD
jgi:outer membrane protein assembly factor BamB